MSDRSIAAPPPALRAAIAADLSAVRPLRPPVVRALSLVPLAGLLLVAAPAVFEVRDLAALGWGWSWGASLLQALAGLGLVAAACVESVPGRPWSRSALVAMGALPIAIVAVITMGSWLASPVPMPAAWPIIAALCLVFSATSALPATALAAVLASGAFPTRPAVAGWLAGLGSGLLADAGWRLFCHYSEPAHVLGAHLGGVLVAGLVGACLTNILARARAPSTAHRHLAPGT